MLYLVVSLDAQSEETSARAAVELGVDVLMGGTRPQVILPIEASAQFVIETWRQGISRCLQHWSAAWS